MLLSRTCVNAIRAGLEIAASGVPAKRQFVPVHEIAGKIGISHHFLGKIAQILTEAGIFNSFRGPNGGIGLARPAKEIYLIDIVEATDGVAVFEKCILGLPECSGSEPCPLHDTWEKVRERLLKRFRNETLASIVKTRRREAGSVGVSHEPS